MANSRAARVRCRPRSGDSRQSCRHPEIIKVKYLARRCFPRHESIEGSSGFIRNKFDYMCIIDQAKKRGLVRNQIEGVHQIIQGCNDPYERVIENLIVLPSMEGAN